VKKLTRRDAFRWLGISIALPMLESTGGFQLANAQSAPKKKRFIGCFFPSGAAMPDANPGDWTLTGALQPLVQHGVQGNVLITRGFRAVNHDDVHWTGTAAFLSCNEVGFFEIAAPNRRAGERCGKSFDQYVADLESTKIRSLHGGWNTVPGWDEGHDSHMSIQYVNCIAWRDERTPIQNTKNPQEMFTRVFGDGTAIADPRIQYLLHRRKSILDGVRGQLGAFRNTLPAADRLKMDAYETGIREVETELTASLQTNTCNGAGVIAEDPAAYMKNMRTMQKTIVKAFQCNATRAATLMYHEGIGDNSIHSTIPNKQHDNAHNNWDELKKINRLQMGLWGELIKDLRDNGLLQETVLVLGSNMSDGRSHNAANAPYLLASAGPELKIGQEVIGTPTLTDERSNRSIADIYMDLFPLYGITRTEFGEGKDKSTGVPSGILA
jgi:hypothetical protein